MNSDNTITLNDGNKIPIVGLGVWKAAPGDETYNAVRKALDVGYRHIDTAQFYGNEESVGKAVTDSGVAREEVFVTSKIAISNFEYDNVIESTEESLKLMGFDYIDLMLLHFPVANHRIKSYEALEKLQSEGKVKSIGVSNFTEAHLDELLENTNVVPVTNQVEMNPYLSQVGLHDHCTSKGLFMTAYSPLTKGEKLDDPKLVELAAGYNKTPAQILIRWCIEHDIIVIPKSVTPSRIEENFNVFDFEISEDDMQKLDSYDEDYRKSWNPYDDKQVKTFSSYVIRKLSGLGKPR